MGEQIDWTVALFTEPVPSEDYSAPCGTHVYELVGGDTTWLTFDATTRALTLHTTAHSDVQTGTIHTIRAYGSLWPSDYIE